MGVNLMYFSPHFRMAMGRKKTQVMFNNKKIIIKPNVAKFLYHDQLHVLKGLLSHSQRVFN